MRALPNGPGVQSTRLIYGRSRFWQIDGSAWRIGVDVSPRRDCLAARLLGFGNGAAPVGSNKVTGKKFDRFEVVTLALNTDSEVAPGALGHQGRDFCGLRDHDGSFRFRTSSRLQE
jgi:hypothetical protein